MSGRETDTERDRERDRLRERENMLLMIRSVCLIKPSLAGKADRKTHTDFSIRCRSPPTERERWRTRGMDGWMERESRLRGRLHDNVERKTFHAVWRFVYTTGSEDANVWKRLSECKSRARVSRVQSIGVCSRHSRLQDCLCFSRFWVSVVSTSRCVVSDFFFSI